MNSAQSINSNLNNQKENEKDNPKENEKENQKDQRKDKQKDLSEYLGIDVQKENQKDHRKEKQKDLIEFLGFEIHKENAKENVKENSKEILKDNLIDHHKDVKSIGKYTGLESLNIQTDEQNELIELDKSKEYCTCNCKCELCINVRGYQDARRLGIDFNLKNTSYLSYLSHLNNLRNFHDVRDHRIEHELDNLEIYHLLPDQKLRIAVITFNMNGKHLVNNLHDLILPDSLECFPDIYVIGVQEFYRDNEEVKEWTIELQSTIGVDHVLLHDVSFGVLHLSLFIRRDLIWHVSIPEDDSLLCRLNPPSNYIRTKGAVAISLKIFGTSFLFVNNHLPAHQSKLQERIDEYYRMIGLDLPRNFKQTLKRSYQSNDVTNRFDIVFWFGDLNFRVDQELDEVLEEIALAKCEKNENNKHCFDSIFLHDQLSLSMKKGEVFTGFEEGEVNFQPTYKYLINTNEYDEQSQRIPSYTDRILFKNKRNGHLICKMYKSIDTILTSDHKPVFGFFEAFVRVPGNDCPSNAGFFNHEVYVEGLKRMNTRRQVIEAEHPERPKFFRKWFHSSVN